MSHHNNLYPHLLPDDINLWVDFLALYGARYVKFEYDIKCGQGRDPGDIHPPNIRRMAHDLSKRRIDVLAHTPDEIHLIEITLSAGFTAIGQCMVYPLLYSLQHPATQDIVPLILCREIQTDIQPALDAHGVHYCILPKSGHKTTTLPFLMD